MNFWDWIEWNQQNKPQSNAVAGGIVFMLASGLQVAWIFNNKLMSFPWTDEWSNIFVILTYVTFYIAAIVGLFVTCLLVDHLSKKIIYVSGKENARSSLIEILTLFSFQL